MSARGLSFLNDWIAVHIPETATFDVISMDDLIGRLVADAQAMGIAREEIDEEVGNLYRAILEAIACFDPGIPES